MPTWDQVHEVLSQPAVTAAVWLGLGVLAWFSLSIQTRVVALSAVGAALGVGLGPAFGLLANFGSSIFIGLAQSALLFADLTLFFAPIALAIDRVVRERLRKVPAKQPRVAYLAAAGTGLATCLAALVALWWVTDITPDLLGSVEVAVFGGVATACLALVRADRQVEEISSQPLP